MTDQEQQKQLMAKFYQYVAQKTGATSTQQVESYLQKLGDQGVKQLYQEFQQAMQSARNGAILSMQRCPKGRELVYFKQGGKTKCGCKKAEDGIKLIKKELDGGKTPDKKQVPNRFQDKKQQKPLIPTKPQQSTKEPTKEQYKKMTPAQKAQQDMKDIDNGVSTDKCGGKMKKTLKKNANGGILIPDNFAQLFKIK